MAIFEVLSALLNKNLATYLLQFGKIVSATHDSMPGDVEIQSYN